MSQTPNTKTKRKCKTCKKEFVMTAKELKEHGKACAKDIGK